MGSVTSAIKQKALCSELQSLWEQREGARQKRQGTKKIRDVGEGLQKRTTDQEML